MPDLRWRKACETSACVEVASTSRGTVLVRTTQRRAVAISLTGDEWQAFKDAVKAGRFEDMP